MRHESTREEYIVLKGETLHGIFPVSMALEAGHRHFHRIYYHANSPRVEPLLDVAMERGIEVSPVSFRNLQRLCRAFADKDKKSVHQGVVADVDRLYPLDAEKFEVITISTHWLIKAVMLTQFANSLFSLQQICFHHPYGFC